MKLSEDDLQLAVRDFFSADPALLLDFVDLPALPACYRWGRERFGGGEHARDGRRLPGEPDAGCATRWSAAADGLRYAVDATGGVRSGFLYWPDVRRVVNSRLTPVRYGALRAAVEAARAHRAAYLPGPAPFRTPDAWELHFRRPWAQRAYEINRAAAAALDALCPPVQAQPFLF
ncbi:hypothetical protein [Streptomyces sp. YGL11-2]|uniref:hypothetical protein n=1 Tax=Streptomyces sp. YGL11-2 TaxID=3414028 RepID=UPI003CF5829E